MIDALHHMIDPPHYMIDALASYDRPPFTI